MKTPRQFLLRGRWEAEGFYFDAASLGEAEARRRILRCWAPGAKVWRAPGGYVLALAAARSTNCSSAPGYPLVRAGRTLSAAPLTERERLRLPPSAESALLMRAGVAECFSLADEDRVDPSDWIELEGLEFRTLTPLGATPAPTPPAPAPAPIVPISDLLTIPSLGSLAERDDMILIFGDYSRERGGGFRALGAGLGFGFESFRSLLRELARGLAFKIAVGRQGAGKGAGATRAPRIGWLARLFGRFFVRKGTKAGGLPPAQTARVGLAGRLVAAFNRFVYFIVLSKVVGRRQTAYLRRTMQLFEEGRILEALHSAIPLADMQKGLNRPLNPAFGLPGVRGDLTISMWLNQRSRAIVVDGVEGYNLLAELRKIYRNAYEELAKQGRGSEAAFVLAELLNDAPAAVRHLENIGELRMAAELAEGRRVHNSIIVRQWMIADEPDRALEAARLGGDYPGAYLILKKSHPDHARRLALLWIRTLAASGDTEAILEVLWHDAALAKLLSDLERSCLDRVLEAEGIRFPSLLARAFALRPERYPELLAAARRLLESNAMHDREPRRDFVIRLAGARPASTTAPVARLALRAMLRDQAAGDSPWSSNYLDSIRGLAKSKSLEIDTPKKFASATSSSSPLISRNEPLRLSFLEAGFAPIQDIIPLPQGRMLLARGQAGVQLVDRFGKLLAAFPHPADALVLADSGRRAIAIERCGGFVRLARLDLDARRSELWVETQLDDWMSGYDGFVWFVARDNMLLALDAQAPGLRTLWSDAPDGEEQLLSLSRAGNLIEVLIRTRDSRLVVRRYDRRQLAKESDIPLRFEPEQAALLSKVALRALPYVAGVGFAAFDAENLTNRDLQFIHTDRYAIPFSLAIDAPGGVAQIPVLHPLWNALPIRIKEGMLVFLIDVHPKFESLIRARIVLPDAKRAAVRFAGQWLYIADSTGRVIQMDIDTGVLVASLRV